jgi:hypothetical protein
MQIALKNENKRANKRTIKKLHDNYLHILSIQKQVENIQKKVKNTQQRAYV